MIIDVSNSAQSMKSQFSLYKLISREVDSSCLEARSFYWQHILELFRKQLALKVVSLLALGYELRHSGLLGYTIFLFLCF